MTGKQRALVDDLMTVSHSLSIWAYEKFLDDWSIEDIKLHIKNAAHICEKH